MATEAQESSISVVSERRAVQPAWLFLCGTLAAGLALWSLYVVGLLGLTIMAVALARVPRSPRVRIASLLAMLVGFEGAIASLTALYWFTWAPEKRILSVSPRARRSRSGHPVLSALGLVAKNRSPSAVAAAVQSYRRRTTGRRSGDTWSDGKRGACCRPASVNVARGVVADHHVARSSGLRASRDEMISSGAIARW